MGLTLCRCVGFISILVMRNFQLFEPLRPVAFALAICLVIGARGSSALCDDAPASTAAAPDAATPAATSAATPSADPEATPMIETPWDFSPYRVQIWIASDDLRVTADDLAKPLADYLDRDFAAIWRLSISDS